MSEHALFQHPEFSVYAGLLDRGREHGSVGGWTTEVEANLDPEKHLLHLAQHSGRAHDADWSFLEAIKTNAASTLHGTADNSTYWVSFEEHRDRLGAHRAEQRQVRRAMVHKALQEAVVEARDDGCGEPSDVAIQSALRVATDLPGSVLGDDPDFSATSEDVSLHLHGGKRRSVLLLFESSGRVRCLVNLNGVHRRAVYDSDVTLPDGFMREALGDVHGTSRWWW